MFSKKEEFINGLQFNIGDRSQDTNINQFKNVSDLSDWFKKRNMESKWKFLNFIPFYYFLKNKVEDTIDYSVKSNFNLNELSKTDKVFILSEIEAEYNFKLELKRPSWLHSLIFIFPLIGILGSLIFGTYLITVKDYSGIIYTTSFIGLILSLGLIHVTKQFKNQFHPESLLDYAKSFYVVRNKHLNLPASQSELENFILDEVEFFYGEPFKLDSKIPE